MKKDMIIDDIINALYDNGCIDVSNFPSRSLAFSECAGLIESILDDYIIIKGEILE